MVARDEENEYDYIPLDELNEKLDEARATILEFVNEDEARDDTIQFEGFCCGGQEFVNED